MFKIHLLVLFLLMAFILKSKTTPVVRYTFNDKRNTDEIKGISSKAIGASYVNDRFNNKNSALYLHGNYGSYLNLGTGSYLKPTAGSISFWFKIDNPVFAGSGIEVNPLILTKSQAGNDFYEGYFVAYDFNLKKVVVTTTYSEEYQVTLHNNSEISLRKWHHIVVTYDDHFLCFYLNGELENKMAKNFKSRFLATDSVMIGNCANTKNKRFLNGSVDDIEIYNKVLNKSEVQSLYNSPDPKKNKIIIKWILFIIAGIALVCIIVFFIFRHFKKELAKEKQKNILLGRTYEQEIRVLKAQMNPHFIFNSLNSIQQFIICNDSEKAQLYLSKFSKLLRKILESNTRESIHLKEEIEILNRYLEIESLRFNHVFNYTIRIGDKLINENYSIPHFLIQPFVENAIWHGLLPKEGDKKLDVFFDYVDEKTLSCVVEDNGNGRIEEKELKTNEEKKSLAINFIEQRLELMSKIMGKEYKVEIIDKTDVKGVNTGTKIIITLPIINI